MAEKNKECTTFGEWRQTFWKDAKILVARKRTPTGPWELKIDRENWIAPCWVVVPDPCSLPDDQMAEWAKANNVTLSEEEKVYESATTDGGSSSVS